MTPPQQWHRIVEDGIQRDIVISSLISVVAVRSKLRSETVASFLEASDDTTERAVEAIKLCYM